ncbi:magnesium transporter CorA family protein [Pararhizobium mangrovi]|uniref:Magnesium transport protein CorA n=1 Tax=Pararhizobium mangrovi TaxID=2590452 RepID=A0A506U9V2_9HYPH|nr:magnesium transporter CorA family protein [Pararhizobium mangrovi]TPW30650.1 magnesium transporter [Pararhizobium mangrovi]
MLHAYTRQAASFDIAAGDGTEPLPDDVVWLDMLSPSAEEEARAEAMLGVDLPTRDELKDIEPSSRLYAEDDTLYMTASLVSRWESGAAELFDIGFVIVGNRLVTIRYGEPKAFRLFLAAAGRQGECGKTGSASLARLLETVVDRTAEILEVTSANMDRLSDVIFKRDMHHRNEHDTSKDLESRLGEIAESQRTTAKVRESLSSLGRLVRFFAGTEAVRANADLQERCASLDQDIRSLGEHAGFISANVTFHLDATLGLINLEQNKIIKIFSIAAVVLLPPTFIGTIYGMNFKDMPELSWAYGYPYALVLMVVVSAIPVVWFRKKGWF